MVHSKNRNNMYAKSTSFHPEGIVNEWNAHTGLTCRAKQTPGADRFDSATDNDLHADSSRYRLDFPAVLELCRALPLQLVFRFVAYKRNKSKLEQTRE